MEAKVSNAQASQQVQKAIDEGMVKAFNGAF